jgi:arylformamidase
MKWSEKIIDISMEISEEMTIYKNLEENRPMIRVTRDFDEGDAYESAITLGMHTGTHLDMPLHMIKGGATLDTLMLDQVVTRCRVLDLTHVANAVTREDLEKLEITADSFILLKTRNSNQDAFDFSFVYLEASGARYLKELGIKGVGIDALGIERNQPKRETHRTLLGSGILILEGLRLKEVAAGDYLLVAAPLKIKGVEAAPVRAMLLELQ